MNQANIQRFKGYSKLYDLSRPIPPNSLIKIIIDISNNEKIEKVVDLGCGTGLSTFIWKKFAKNIIGIEPNEDMRKEAIKKLKKVNNIEFLYGNSFNTNLESNSIDIVTCSQSFHWMEPKESLKEINRILKDKGLFIAYDVDWPPLTKEPLMTYFDEFMKRTLNIGKEKELFNNVISYPKNEHLKNIRESGYFSYNTEFLLNKKDTCNSKKFVNLALSQGGVNTLIQNGITYENIGLIEFKSKVREIIGKNTFNIYWNYRIRVGIK